MAEERLLAYRTKGTDWGKERAVVVTYNPASARTQSYTLNSKLERIRNELLSMRSKVREKAPHWRNLDVVTERYSPFLRASSLTQRSVHPGIFTYSKRVVYEFSQRCCQG